MALPETGLTIDMIRQTLAASTYNLGELCVHPNINMFAKYKPVILPQYFHSGNPDWWKSVNRNCGIKTLNVETLKNNVSNGFFYERPSGNDSSPYRMCDFHSYDQFAKPQYTVGFPQNIYGASDNLILLYEQYSPTALTFADIFGDKVGDMYFVVELYSANVPEYLYATSTDTIGSGGNRIVNMNLKNLYETALKSGTSIITVGVCNFKLDGTKRKFELPQGYELYILPYTSSNPVQKSIANTTAPAIKYEISVIGWDLNVTRDVVSGSFTIKNTSGKETYNFRTGSENLAFNLRMYDPVSGEEIWRDVQPLPSITPSGSFFLDPGDTKTFTIYFDTLMPSGGKPFEYWFIISQKYREKWYSVGSIHDYIQ